LKIHEILPKVKLFTKSGHTAGEIIKNKEGSEMAELLSTDAG
jgi:hypothetical protein